MAALYISLLLQKQCMHYVWGDVNWLTQGLCLFCYKLLFSTFILSLTGLVSVDDKIKVEKYKPPESTSTQKHTRHTTQTNGGTHKRTKQQQHKQHQNTLK